MLSFHGLDPRGVDNAVPIMALRRAVIQISTDDLAAVDALETGDKSSWQDMWAKMIDKFTTKNLSEMEFQAKTDKQWDAEWKRVGLQLSFTSSELLTEKANKIDEKAATGLGRKELIAFVQRKEFEKLKNDEIELKNKWLESKAKMLVEFAGKNNKDIGEQAASEIDAALEAAMEVQEICLTPEASLSRRNALHIAAMATVALHEHIDEKKGDKGIELFHHRSKGVWIEKSKESEAKEKLRLYFMGVVRALNGSNT